jgi:hypothetical protein
MLREEHLLRVSEPTRDEVKGGWGKLHHEFHHVYSSQNIIRAMNSRRIRWVGQVAQMGGDEKCVRNFGWKACRNRPLGRPRRRWEDNIWILGKWDLWAWIGSIWLRIVTGGNLL